MFLCLLAPGINRCLGARVHKSMEITTNIKEQSVIGDHRMKPHQEGRSGLILISLQKLQLLAPLLENRYMASEYVTLLVTTCYNTDY